MHSTSTQPHQALRLTAHAKINLGLEVLHKRTDGFHALNTLFVRVALADCMTITSLPEQSATGQHQSNLHVFCSPALDVPEEQNLAFKAASLLASEAPNLSFPPTHIDIEKHIPTGGGLGGGSSNAASTLLALNDVWNVNASKARLHVLAAQLGSDVPFFLLNAPIAIGASRGEVLQPLDFTSSYTLPYWIVLVCPGIHISTPWAYKALQRSEQRSEDAHARQASDYKALLSQCIANPSLFQQYFVNDFEEVVFREHPPLERIKSRLYDAGAFFALMSGSGSTMFGLFHTEEAATAAQKQLAEYTTFVCQNV
jgi:4-diphosphocytidyl-2-C-methyl-D-erythritol kinase